MDHSKSTLGSQTAKSGFDNESLIIGLINNWKKESIGKNLIKKMRINLSLIKSIRAEKVPVRNKTDIVLIEEIEGNKINKHNISIKKYGYSFSDDGKKNKFNYNQVDKRTVDKAREKWSMPDDVADELRKFTSEEGFSAKDLFEKGSISKEKYDSLKDKRRILLNEMDENIQNKIIDFFDKNKKKIVSDIMRGEGEYAADWLLVNEVELNQDKTVKKINRMAITPIEEAISLFSFGNTYLTKRGNLKIGKITLQRKGGTPDPSKLQFKISPEEILKKFWKNERKLY